MYLPQQKGQALVTSIISAWYLCKEHFLHFGVCAYIARITKKKIAAVGGEKWSDLERESRDEAQGGGDGAVIRADGDRL